jgi:23S rRNA pseudouridine2604 synthase
MNRQIRLMAAAFGYRVTELRRVRINQVRLGTLRLGQWRNLTDAELAGLLPGRSDW